MLTRNFNVATAFSKCFEKSHIFSIIQSFKQSAFFSHFCNSKMNDIIKRAMYRVCFELKLMAYNP